MMHPQRLVDLLDLGMPAHLIKATLNGVMAQRLVRTLCPDCRSEVQCDPEAWQQLGGHAKSACNCISAAGLSRVSQHWILGREGIYEIMPISDELLSHISAESDIQQVRDAAISQGMKTLRMAGAEKVAAGITSIAEVLRVTPELGVRRQKDT